MIKTAKGWTLKCTHQGKPKNLYILIYDEMATDEKRNAMESSGVPRSSVFSVYRQLSIGRIDNLNGDAEKIYENIKKKIIKHRLILDEDRIVAVAEKKAMKIMEDWGEIYFEGMRGC